MKGTLVSSESWKMIGGKILEESNARVNMVNGERWERIESTMERGKD